MRVVFGVNKFRNHIRPVVALGVFDGVHRAHRQILKAAVREAGRIKGTSVAITFYPHPQKKESLYSLSHRLRLIAALGIDICIVIKFTQAILLMTAEDFIKKILHHKIRSWHIYVGENFRFGRGAKGNYKILAKFAPVYNYRLKVFKLIKINNKAVSSTHIRQLISRGKLKDAQDLLLTRVSVLGTVVKGRTLARKLGFPTANINPHHEVLPPSGVYAVEVIYNNKRFRGVCNIGIKPTFSSGKRAPRVIRKKIKNIEVYLFAFRQNIYAKNLEIQFIKKLRNEKKFKSPLLLARQIQKDIEVAEAVISRHQ